jgi:hypothetical protein
MSMRAEHTNNAMHQWQYVVVNILNSLIVRRKHDSCAMLALESGGCAMDTGVNYIEKLNNVFWYKLLEITSVTFE